MHEMALASNVVETVVAAAQSSNASKVTEIWLRIGIARDIIDDLFEGLIKHLSRRTLAENAELVIVRVPLTVRCDDCGSVYPIDYREIKAEDHCPRCHSERYHLNSGMEFDIDRIEVV